MASEKTPAVRITLKKISPVGMWSWAGNQDTCGICRNTLDQPSIDMIVRDADPAEACIGWGACSHAFHTDCVSKWLKKHNKCPLCNAEWEFARTERVDGVAGKAADSR